MALRITGKHLDLGETLRERVKSRVEAALLPLFGTRWKGSFTVKKDGHQFHVDCLIHIDNAATLHSESSEGEAYAACDAAVHHLEQNLRRYKQKLKMRVPAKAIAVEAPASAPSLAAKNDTAFAPVIIAETMLALPLLSVSQAVSALEESEAAFFMFQHAASNRVNFVYKRKDGHIGWIDPENLQKALKKAA